MKLAFGSSIIFACPRTLFFVFSLFYRCRLVYASILTGPSSRFVVLFHDHLRFSSSHHYHHPGLLATCSSFTGSPTEPLWNRGEVAICRSPYRCRLSHCVYIGPLICFILMSNDFRRFYILIQPNSRLHAGSVYDNRGESLL
jgi:hypothetical protein